MRDIKFRVKYGGAWCYINLNEGLTELGYKAYMECVLKKEVFYQYTGLRDKNGKEIYEGDIVREEFDSKVWIYEIMIPVTGVQNFYRIVRYRNFRADGYGQYEYGDFYLQENTVELHESRDYEVIGNIHENPELLNK